MLAQGRAAPVFLDAADYPGVLRAAGDLCADVERVGGVRPALVTQESPRGETVVIAGTLGKSALIDQLVKAGKIPTADIAGKWESFIIATVDAPMPGRRAAPW